MGSQFNRGVKILSVGGVVIQWPPVSRGRNSTWKIRWILIAARWIKTPGVEIQWGQNSILHRQWIDVYWDFCASLESNKYMANQVRRHLDLFQRKWEKSCSRPSLLNFTYRYIANVLFLSHQYFENNLDQLYLVEFEIKDMIESNTSASYLDLLMSIGRTVNFSLQFTTHATISISISYTFRYWVGHSMPRNKGYIHLFNIRHSEVVYSGR